MSTVPTIHLPNFVSLDQRAQKLGEALETTGFVVLTGHGVDPSLLERAYIVARRLFTYSDRILKKYETPENGRQSGYGSFGCEHARDQQDRPDQKRYWMIRRPLPPNHPRRLLPWFVENIWPTEVVAFQSVMKEVFEALDREYMVLLKLISIYLGRDPDFLPDIARDGESVLRVINYPRLTTKTAQKGLRSAPHGDINLLTLLPAAKGSGEAVPGEGSEGLEVMAPSGEWIPINNPPDALIVNVADMLEILSAGRFRSVLHRVVNPAVDPVTDLTPERYSMPYFGHARGEAVIDPQSGLTAGEALQKRLREINGA